MIEEGSAEVHIKQFVVSPVLYRKGYSGGRGPCTCTSVCCQNGVYADVGERDRILEHADIVRKHMDETQSPNEHYWFEDHESEDSDFASGRCIGTAVINGKCAFLDKLGRCSLQVTASSEEMHKWALKPVFCILFPLEISNNVISFDDFLDDDQECCSIAEKFDVPLFKACKDELTHVLGEDGYKELESFYRMQAPTPAPVLQQ